MRLILGLILRVAALPVLAQAVLAVALYTTDGLLAEALSLVFVLASTLAILLWVGRSITAHVRSFHRGEGKWSNRLSSLLPAELTERRAVDQLAVAARSMVFYTLLIGYLLLASVFALTYDALGITTDDTLWGNLYFSLTTLTTVGYGDVQPVGFGRFIASVEMVAGLTYQVLAIGGGMAYVSGLSNRTDSDQAVGGDDPSST